MTQVRDVDAGAVAALCADWEGDDRPGCAVGVVRDGRLVHAAGHGMADLGRGAPNSPGSVFYIASVSKQFTAACALLLEADGAVSLDDGVRRYFPELPEVCAPITLRHLLHHTSGLRDYLDLWELNGRSHEEPFRNADGLALVVRQRGLNFAPGTRHLYCNSGYKLLAELVPRVTGQALRQFSSEQIFAPLGMAHTWFDDDNAEVPGRVQSYRREGEAWVPVRKAFTIVGSGGVLSTLDDLTRWDRNYVDGAVGGADWAARMETPGVLDDGTVLDYACGLKVGAWKGLRSVAHAGGMLGFRAHFQRFPDQGLAVIVLGNAATLDAAELAGRVADLYLVDHYRLAGWAGAYISDEVDPAYVIEVDGAGLGLRAPGSLAGPLRETGADTWATTGEAKRELVFQRGADGDIAGFVLNSGRARGLRFRRA